MENVSLYVDPESRDLVIEDGGIRLVSGDEMVAQAVRVTLLVYLREWFLDVRHGTDYERIMGLSPTDAEVDQIIRAAVYQEDAVQHIEQLDIARRGRMLHISLSAKLKSGTVASLEVSI